MPTSKSLAKINRKHRLRAQAVGAIVDYAVKPDTLRQILRRGVCRYCLSFLANGQRTLDHIIPLSRLGEHTLSNLALACPKCNVDKGCMTEEEYFEVRGDKRARDQRETVIQNVLRVKMKIMKGLQCTT